MVQTPVRRRHAPQAALLALATLSGGCAFSRELGAVSFHLATLTHPSSLERRALPHGITSACGRGSITWIVPVGDDAVVLIDTGFDDAATSIRAAVGQRRILGILVTHGHLDHVAGTSSLDAPVWIGREDAPALAGRPTFRAAYPRLGEAFAGIPVARGEVHPVDDGDVVSFSDGPHTVRFTAVGTPGHTRGSISWLFERVLFGGDAVQSPLPGTVFPAPAGFTEDLHDAYASIRRLRTLDIDFLADAHYGVLPEPATAMREALERDHSDARRTDYPGLRPVGCGDDQG